MSSAEIGLRVQKSSANPLGYLHIDKIPSDEVCVVYLGGDGATDDKAANGYAKIIENEILEDIKNKIPVYSITYNFTENKKDISRRLEYIKHRRDVLSDKKRIQRMISKAKEEDYNPRYIDTLFEKIILPRISVSNGKEKLPVDEACKRIRKLNIVAHCHGGYVALKLEDKMQQVMKNIGYSSEERKRIQSQLLIVAHAPACPLGISKSQFVSFRSIYDLDIPKPDGWFDSYIYKRVGEERTKFYGEQYNQKKEASENRWFDFSPCYFAGKQGNLFLIKQKYEWNDDDGPFLINKEEHNDVHYLDEKRSDEKQTKDGKMLADIARNILKNGIANSLAQQEKFLPLPPLEELILSDKKEEHEKESKNFQIMKQNGRAFRQEACDYALKRIKELQKDISRS